jgi:hypothetical protein
MAFLRDRLTEPNLGLTLLTGCPTPSKNNAKRLSVLRFQHLEGREMLRKSVNLSTG